MQSRRLVKTRCFQKGVYVGDPVNCIRIFNEKEVDELMLLDIGASQEGQGPDIRLLSQVTSECFMPLAYGGGIRSIQEMHDLFSIGIEKVVLNRQAADNPDLISSAAERFGSQSIVVSIDARKHRSGEYRVWTASGTRETGYEASEFAAHVERMGAGELLVTSIERDGTMSGYDLELIRRVTSSVNIPVIACGGGGTLDDLHDAVIHGGASAAAAGSMFVFHGPHRAVLINFPRRAEIERLFHFSILRPEA